MTLRHKKFLLSLLGFSALNVILYLYILFFQDRVQFNRYNYSRNAHHYFIDPRSAGGDFEFLRALGSYDAQWYLRIASEGYPKNPVNTNIQDKAAMDGPTYAFFPLYPATIAIINFFLSNIELTAFIMANLLMVANFTSLYFVITKLYSEKIALKTSFLLFLFPFSIFYRSYFTEGLFLLLLIWFSYLLIKKRWLGATIAFSLITITRPNGLFLAPIFASLLYKGVKNANLSWQKAVGYLALSAVPLSLWMVYNFLQTGSPLYWYTVQSAWYTFQNLSFPLINNLKTILSFQDLPLHSFHSSKLDVLTILGVFVLLIMSRKKLAPILWWISLVLWLFPLLLKDTMSFSRYQIVSFPLFLYLATVLKGNYYLAAVALAIIGLFRISLYFINWWWLG